MVGSSSLFAASSAKRCVWAAALLILMGSAGCQSPPLKQPGSGGADGAEQKVVLTVWNDWTGQDPTSETMRGLLGKFQQDNPDVEVRQQSILRDAYRSRLKTMAAADELPDVFLIWPDSMTREFVRGGLIQPLDDMLNAHAGLEAGFMPHSFDSFTVDGGKYSVPLSMAPSSFVFYNQAIFNKYGVRVPQTWDELLAAIRIFNENGITPIALGNKSSWVAPSFIFSTLADRMTGTEWFRDVISQNGAKFTDPIFLKALHLLQELVAAKAFQDNFNYIDNMQMEQLYYRKQAAMFVGNGSAVANLIAGAPQDVQESTHLALLPQVPGGIGNPYSTSGVVGAGFAINSKLSGAQRQAAFKLIYALSGPDAQRSILDSNTLVSYRLDVDHSRAHPLFIELHQLMKSVTMLPAYETQLTTAAVEALNAGIQDVLKGGSPEDMARNLQTIQASTFGKFR